MERAILVIVLLVAMVGVVGLFASYDFGPSDTLDAGITGHVVASGGHVDCGSCAGYAPVCAKLNNRYITYENACEATCSGARVVRTFPCEQI